MAEPLDYRSPGSEQPNDPEPSGFGCALTSVVGAAIALVLAVVFWELDEESRRGPPPGGPDFSGVFWLAGYGIALALCVFGGLSAIFITRPNQRLVRRLSVAGLVVGLISLVIIMLLLKQVI
jgi:hypothetical protein